MNDVSRVPEPPDGDERSVLLGWLAFHRNALEAKCAGLDAAQLVTRSTTPSALSLLFVWGVYTDDGPEWDIEVDESMVPDSMAAWHREKAAADERIGHHATLDSIGAGNGYSLRWNLQKLVGEYARHNGHADILRERIDGQTGE
jgi:Protein of unknown function (DUF664)